MITKEFDLFYANALFLKKQYRDAFEEYFSGAIDHHSPQAAFNLAFMYHLGISVPRNYMMAHKFYIAASNLDGGEAQFNLALMYLRGQGVDVDPRRAADYMKISAARECINAQLYLGAAYTMGRMFDPMDIECISLIPFYRVIKRDISSLYLSGTGHDRQLDDAMYEVFDADEYDAVEMFEAAAGHKDITYIEEQVGIAKETLGHALIEGVGREYAPEKGFKLIEKAAVEHGSKEAALFLNMNKDKAKAYGIDAAKTKYLIED